MQKDFNIIIAGTGGQGLITLLQILSEAAFIDGYDIKTSELHGLSQRGGSVEVHIRFGKKIYSPMLAQGSADLVLCLELQESLRMLYFANSGTNFLINNQVIPNLSVKPLPEAEVLSILKKASKNIFFVPAGETCQEKLGTDVVSGIYLLGYAVSKKLIPLEQTSVISAIKKIIPEKFLELNLKTFELAESRAVK